MEESPGSFPIPPGAYIQETILPPASMDMRWWILDAQSLLQSDSLRIRDTSIDNAPAGREVHWSSGLIWLIAGMAKLISYFTGQPALDRVAGAAMAAPLILLALSVAGIGIMVAKRLGPAMAGLFVLILFSSRTVDEGFVYGMADHHGIVFSFAFASVLALVFGGVGLVKTRKSTIPFLLEEASARRWMILSGILGGAALWVSAATAIPVLAGCGLGAIAAAWFARSEAALIKPDLWRSWGRAGCATSIFFYLLEYFPNHMGWRLEVNHPLHALAWLAAAELLTRLLSTLFNGKPFVKCSPSGFLKIALATVFLLMPPAMAISRPDLFFDVSDKFLLALHNQYINEFESLWTSLSSGEAVPFLVLTTFVWPLVALLGIPLLLWRKNVSPVWRTLALFVLCPLLIMQALAFAQVRWQGMATGLWLIEILVLLAAFTVNRSTAQFPRWILLLLGGLSFVAGICFPLSVFVNAIVVSASFEKGLRKRLRSHRATPRRRLASSHVQPESNPSRAGRAEFLHRSVLLRPHPNARHPLLGKQGGPQKSSAYLRCVGFLRSPAPYPGDGRYAHRRGLVG
jgi:hypothetical protein